MTTTRSRNAVCSACFTALLGCTLEQDSNPFGHGGGYPVGTTATPAASDTGEPSSSGDDDGEDGDDSGDDGDHGDSSGGGADPSTTMPATTDPTGDAPGGSSDGGADPTGAVPGAGGLYDHCLQPEDCGPGTTACLQIVDMAMMPIAGFCTHEGCSDPAADCAPPTSGTAQPYCLPVMIGNMQDAVCALDCSGGQSCPDGTVCIQLQAGWVCG